MIVDINSLDLTDKGFVPAPQFIVNGINASKYGVVIDKKLTVVDLALNTYEYTIPADVDDVVVCRLVGDDKVLFLTPTALYVYTLMDSGTMTESTKIALDNIASALFDIRTMFLVVNNITFGVVGVQTIDGYTELGNHVFRQDISDDFTLAKYNHVVEKQVVVFQELTDNIVYRFGVDDNIYSVIKKVQTEQISKYNVIDDLYFVATANGIKIQREGHKATSIDHATLLTSKKNFVVSNTLQWLTAGFVAFDNFYEKFALTNAGLPLQTSEQKQEFEFEYVYACETCGDILYAIVASHDVVVYDILHVDFVAINSSGFVVLRKFLFSLTNNVNGIKAASINTRTKKCAFLAVDNFSPFLQDGTWRDTLQNGMYIVTENGKFKIMNKDDIPLFYGNDDAVVKTGKHAGEYRYMRIVDIDETEYIVDLPITKNQPKLAVRNNGEGVVVFVDNNRVLTCIDSIHKNIYNTKLSDNVDVAWTSSNVDNDVLVGLTTGQVFNVDNELNVVELEGDKVNNVMTTIDEIFTVVDNKIHPVTVDEQTVTIHTEIAYAVPDDKVLAIRRDDSGLYAFTKRKGVIYVNELQRIEG